MSVYMAICFHPRTCLPSALLLHGTKHGAAERRDHPRAQVRLACDHGERHEDDEALAEPVLDHQVVELREVGAFGKQEVGGVPS